MTNKIEDIMTRRVFAVGLEDSMETIRDGMETYGVRHIPVVDGGKVVGLLTRTDILGFSESQFRTSRVSRAIDDTRMEETFVAEVMTRDVRSVRPQLPIADAADLLLKHKLGCLPVTEADGTLVGIVTKSDFVKALVDLLRKP
jgi:CBS domain-containing membrane protein